eukprot:592843-Rhodomonas_salina.1
MWIQGAASGSQVTPLPAYALDTRRPVCRSVCGTSCAANYGTGMQVRVGKCSVSTTLPEYPQYAASVPPYAMSAPALPAVPSYARPLPLVPPDATCAYNGKNLWNDGEVDEALLPPKIDFSSYEEVCGSQRLPMSVCVLPYESTPVSRALCRTNVLSPDVAHRHANASSPDMEHRTKTREGHVVCRQHANPGKGG